MALDVQAVGSQIVARAAQIAGKDWEGIATAATIELRGLAQRIALIIEAYGNGELSTDGATRHLRAARSHVIATLAMLTMMTEAMAEQIVNGALAIVKEAINSAAGFSLLL